MKKINILGTDYIIKEENLLDGIDGQADKITKTIRLDLSLNSRNNERDVERKDLYKNQVLRHEVIHAIMYESGLDCSCNPIHK